MEKSEIISATDISGIKIVFMENLGNWTRIIPQEYVKVNAYYRKLEDKKNGQAVKSDGEYEWLAIEMFEKLGLTIVDDRLYESFCVQKICSCHGLPYFRKAEDGNADHNKFFREHPYVLRSGECIN